MPSVFLFGHCGCVRKKTGTDHVFPMLPAGHLPLQAPLEAGNLGKAQAAFPDAMRQALTEMVEKIKEMQFERRRKEMGGNSGIIIPGR